ALGILRSLDQPRRGEVSEERFMVVQSEIDRDWMERGDAFVLRVQHDREPLSIYVRFVPQPIAMEKWIRAEGFLRRSERGALTLTVKSPRLLSYGGTLSDFDPACWNRALAHRLRPFASQFPAEVALVEALALGRGERLAEEIRN